MSNAGPFMDKMGRRAPTTKSSNSCPICLRPEPAPEVQCHESGCECDACRATCWRTWGSEVGCEPAVDRLTAERDALKARVEELVEDEI
jgi:hypothetical protein